jgi:hypothetical protein
MRPARTRWGSCSPRPSVDGRGCTTRQEKTHRTTVQEVCYPWHPWFGRRVIVVEGVRRSDYSVFRCSLEGDEGGRGLELPQWMLDRASCLGMQAATAPVVRTIDLTNLRSLFQQLESGRASQAVEDQHCSSNPQGDADGSTSLSSRSDSTGTVPTPAGDARVATVADGRASEDGSSLGTLASRTSSRLSHQGGGR